MDSCSSTWLVLQEYIKNPPGVLPNHRQFTTFVHKNFQRPVEEDNDNDDFKNLSQPSAENSATFCKWIHLLAGHWELSSIVSYFVIFPLKFDFVAVKPPNYSSGTWGVGNWKTTLRSLIKEYWPKLEGEEYPVCLQDVISVIEKHLASTRIVLTQSFEISWMHDPIGEAQSIAKLPLHL